MKDKINRKCMMEKKYIAGYILLIILPIIIFASQEITGSSSGVASSYANVVDLTAPTIDIISPSANYSTTSTTINFLYNVSDTNNVSNCSLIINDIIDQTDNTINKSQMQEFIETFGLGIYSTYINCTDARGNRGNSTVIIIIVTSSSSPSGGGGGGGGKERTSMKILVPSMLTINKTGESKFDINLENDGDVNFNDVSIKGYIIGDSKILDTPVTFDSGFIKLLEKGKKETISVTTFIEDPEILFYEVVINVTSKTPVYNTYNKVFLNFMIKDKTNIVKIIAFTEEFINENAECMELKDMLEDSKKELAAGNLEEANKKAQAAIEACKRTIEGLEKPQVLSQKKDSLPYYLAIAAGSAVVLGLLFNLYRQIRFRGWKKFIHKNN